MNPQVHIINYQEQFQPEIDMLMESIQYEFVEAISSNNIIRTVLLPDLYLLAFVETKLVGTISITRLEHNHSVLRKMFLHKNYRGQGIAELLLQNIVNWANKTNVTSIFLGTMTQFTAAQKFYERHEFKKIDKQFLPNDFPVNLMDSIFYKRNLIQSL